MKPEIIKTQLTLITNTHFFIKNTLTGLWTYDIFFSKKIPQSYVFNCLIINGLNIHNKLPPHSLKFLFFAHLVERGTS